MFDFNDEEYIKRCIDNRAAEGIVIPIYIDIYGEKYRIDELDENIDNISKHYFPGILKVGFGCLISALDKCSFRVSWMTEVSILKCIETFDTENNIDVNYFVFETNGLLGDTEMHNQVSYYIDMIRDALSEKVKEYKDEMKQKMIEMEKDKEKENNIDSE